jgi:polysaccharide export outer membrane protein
MAMSAGRVCAAGLLAAGVLSWAACFSRPPRVLAERETPFGDVPPAPEYQLDYRIGTGDILRVNVFGQPELSSAPYESGMPGTPVDSAGHIMLPLIGTLDVQGRTLAEVTEQTTAALRRYLKDPRVDVAVVRFGAHRFLVLGEVRVPGAYVLDRPITAMEALARSGGFGTYANRRQVAWVRGAIEEDNVALFDAADLDPLAANLVRPGDILFVGRKSWADVAEAARDITPILQLIALPVSVALQTITVSKID